MEGTAGEKAEATATADTRQSERIMRIFPGFLCRCFMEKIKLLVTKSDPIDSRNKN